MVSGLVTVVIPVYNVEAYLDRCVKSVVEQTYKNLEIILVDDGSPDNCPAMCDAWAQKDKRIKVVHKENAGAGYARNTGIENATGEYICFFDSDDYVMPSLIEECYTKAKEEKADIVTFGHVEVDENGKKLRERIPSPAKEMFVGREIQEVLVPRTLSHNAATGENWNLLLTVWSMMVSTEFIRQAEWKFVSERVIFSEDYYSLFELYQFAGKVAVIRKAYYCYFMANAGSLSHSYNRHDYQKIRQMAKEMILLAQRYECKTKAEIYTMYLGFVIASFKMIVSCNESFKEKWKHISNIVQDEYLQEVMAGYNYSAEGIAKKALYRAIQKKSTGLCYGMAILRNLKG